MTCCEGCVGEVVCLVAVGCCVCCRRVFGVVCVYFWGRCVGGSVVGRAYEFERVGLAVSVCVVQLVGCFGCFYCY